MPTGVFSQKVGCWPRLPLAHQLALSLPVLALSAALHHLAGQPSWHSPHGTSSHDAHGGHAHDTLGGDTDEDGCKPAIAHPARQVSLLWTQLPPASEQRAHIEYLWPPTVREHPPAPGRGNACASHAWPQMSASEPRARIMHACAHESSWWLPTFGSLQQNPSALHFSAQ